MVFLYENKRLVVVVRNSLGVFFYLLARFTGAAVLGFLQLALLSSFAPLIFVDPAAIA